MIQGEGSKGGSIWEKCLRRRGFSYHLVLGILEKDKKGNKE